MTQSLITTHVLDTSLGKPAAGIDLELSRLEDGQGFVVIGTGTTDDDGRCRTLLPAEHNLQPGTYKILFAAGPYLPADSFYADIEIQFIVQNPTQHYHVPLLLSPFGYSTYRGS